MRVAWLALPALLGCSGGNDDVVLDPAELTLSEVAQLRQHWPLPAVPVDPTNNVGDDPYAQHLGQYLFFDTRFSVDDSVSCATCHDPALGWADGQRLSNTLASTGRHAPSVVNAAYNRWQFWDGRCDSLWCQAAKPFEDPVEMGGNRVRMVRQVVADVRLAEAYVDLFGELPDVSDGGRFPTDARPVPNEPEHPHNVAWRAMLPEDRDAVSVVLANLSKAIAAYERRIVSRDSRFDTFAEAKLMGLDTGSDALEPAARRGLKTFLGRGQCVACHSGPAFSNFEFHNVGLGPRDWLNPEDTGRVEGIVALADEPFSGSGVFSDDPAWAAEKLDFLVITNEQEGQFKTPGLRGVTASAPYFHGGHAETLEDVLQHYVDREEAPGQGHAEELMVLMELDDSDIPDLVAFLRSLDGAPLDATLLEAPLDPRYSP
ncbi:MAG: cytochrome-c peroxidase [Myxococcota bacterium]